MNMNPMTSSMRACWRLLATALMMLGLGIGQAFAAITVSSITMPAGGPNYVKGSTITVIVRVTLTSTSRLRSMCVSTTPTSTINNQYFPFADPPKTDFAVPIDIVVPTASGVFQLNVTAWNNPNCNGVGSPVKSLPGAINTNVSALHHLRLIHDGNGLTCAPENVSIRACADDTCSALFTGSVTANLAATNGATWAPASVTITGGTASAALSNSNAVISTMSGTVTAGTTPVRCYVGGTQNCAIQFANMCTLNAVEVGKGNGTPLFTKRTGTSFNLNILSMTNGVINTSSNAPITATVVAANGTGCSTTALSNVFTGTFVAGDAGRKSVTFTPNQAHRNARVRMVSGSNIVCSSDAFAIRPAQLSEPILGVGKDATASVNYAVTAKAGVPFNLAMTSFAGYDAVPLFKDTFIEAPEGTLGAFTGTISAGPNPTGSFKYAEVGFFRLLRYAFYDDTFTAIDQINDPEDCNLDPSLAADANVATPDGRIGCHFGSPLTEYYGRFIPNHFALTAASMGNRSVMPTCLSTFTYMGELMTPTFTLTAQNADNAVTKNYDKDLYITLDPVTGMNAGFINAPVTGARTPVPVCGATPVGPCFTPAAVTGSFVEGVAAVVMPVTFHRGATPVTALDALKFGVAPKDPDNVATVHDIDTVNAIAGPNNHTLVGSTILRYGRMHIDNVYGSELLNMPMIARAQYWTGTRFATNTLDSCTPQSYSPFVAADYNGGLDATNMPFANLLGTSPLVGGVGKFTIAKPSTLAKKGSVQIRSTYTDYLPGYGRATFGVYRAGPVIYVRETY